MSIAELSEELVEEFDFLEDWMDKYTHLIELGRELEPMPDEYKDEEHIVRGCQSKVWLHAEQEGSKVKFLADSDAIITKGLIAMLVKVLSNHSAKEIMDADLSFLDRIGVREHLSPNRSNGLNAMLKQMKYYAIAMHAKENQNG
ncbi:MAG: SufE family protein [Bacteroidia bacterium]|nr:SufE family protein [Bacteroidia bacterium]